MVTDAAVIPSSRSSAVTLTQEVERQPDAQLTELEAFTFCSSASIGALHESEAGGYTQVLPLDPEGVVDNDDGSFAVTVAMAVTEAQPVIVHCDVSGSMRDLRV